MISLRDNLFEVLDDHISFIETPEYSCMVGPKGGFEDCIKTLVKDYALTDVIIAALPSMVQPLVWEQVEHRYYSDKYTIIDFGHCFLVEVLAQANWSCDSLEEAKTAAQAHYTNNIMKALGVVTNA